MDQITDLSMPAPAESGAHLAHSAATPTTTFTVNHPPYADMIVAAITALKDKDGSSRQAIAKYIEKVYTNLPPSHSTLLTNHLKRLKNTGQLVMIKHSYALPRSDNFSFAGDFQSSQPSPPASAAPNTVPTADGSAKRKPGRPPKTRPDTQFQQQPMAGAGFDLEPQPPFPITGAGYTPEFPAYAVGVPGFGGPPDVQTYPVGSAPGFGSDAQQSYPVAETGTGPAHYPVGGPEPMFVSLGLDDGPVAPSPAPPAVVASAAAPTTVAKRGRGRPPKGSSTPTTATTTNGPVATTTMTVASGGDGQTLGKRARGRSVKPPRSITEIMSNGGLNKAKKGRGRSKVTGPVVVPLGGGSPRPQGRPKRGPKSSGRPRGRPPKIGAGVVVPIEGGGGVVSTARRSGRPARNAVGVARKLSGKPMGRPRKTSAVTAVLVTDPQQLVGYQELKSKYEYIQLKVRQAASVLRPCLNHDDAISALGALQELEVLAGGDVNNAPVNAQIQEPPPQLLDQQESLF